MDIFAEIKHIYELLQDEQSKNIFINRFLGMLTGEKMYWNQLIDNYGSELIQRIGHCEQSKDDFFSQLDLRCFQKERKVALYGIGEWGKRVIQNLPPESEIVICDQKAENGITEYQGFPLITCDQLVKDYKDYEIIITSSAYCLEIENRLLKQGIKKDRIQCLCDNSHVNECDSYQQYFDNKFMIPGKDEIFVDAGMYNGESALCFIRWCNGNYKKIIGFEPSKANISLCNNNSKLLDVKNLTIYNKGLWDKEEVLRFDIANGTDSSISSDGTETIETVTLDSILNGEQVTFIKMDIEGAELNALRGAKETIRKYAPRLAVCVYHKPEDLIELPKYIHTLVPEYKFYLRHYSTYSQETVLYAVID